MWELLVGPLPGWPGGLIPDHLCRVSNCVKVIADETGPAHLELVTQRENMRRGIKGELTTHCPWGHPYDEANTYVDKNGHRNCRACYKRKNHIAYARRTGESLKVLTVRQPWASLIVAGIKDVENRSWATHRRGLLAIHAGKSIDRGAPAELFEMVEDCPLGALVGSVSLDDIQTDSPSRWAQPGSFHWCVSGAQRIEPVPMVGHLGLWDLPEEYCGSLAVQVG
jgi:hypothetical protein